jgi:hypothetical protein
VTTPNQASPDGAITIGGGEWKYGQTINEATARAAFEFPMPTPGNMLDLLRISLERLPLDALQPFADFLGIVDGVFTSIGEAVDAILGSLVERVFQTVQDFNEWVKDFFESLGSGLLTADLTDFAEWWDETITQPVVGSVDGFIRGALGLIGSGFNVTIVEDTARALKDSLADMSDIVTKLNQQATAGKFTGLAVSLPFASVSTLSTYFSQTTSGTGAGSLALSSGKLVWSGTATDRSSLLRYTPAVCKSDYQKVGAAYATIPSTNFLGLWRSYNYLYGRMNTAGNSYVYAKIGASDLELGCYVSGSKTVFSTLSGFKFKPGSAYWLECGTSGGARIFRIWQNNIVILTYTDASSISQLGASNRSVGLGATAATNTYLPAQVSAFAFYDNVPAVVTGCGWRVTRTSSAPGNITNTTSLFPTVWFDTIDYMSDDLAATYSYAHNRITCPADGWYAVSVYQYGNNNLAAFTGGKNRAALFKNGTAVQFSNPIPSNINVGYNGFGGTFTVYCQEGDYLQRAMTLTGLALGCSRLTLVALALIGPGRS